MTPKSDTRWIAAFRDRYADWWEGARGLIAEHRYGAAFQTYPWPTFAETPWAPVTKPLADSRLAVVSTGGLYRHGVDPPFDVEALEGDPSWRAIPRDAPPSSLSIAHTHFPNEMALADLNTIFPLSLLGELIGEGALGELAGTHYSTMGYQLRVADLAEGTAPLIAARMREEGVDVALIVPV